MRRWRLVERPIGARSTSLTMVELSWVFQGDPVPRVLCGF
jgi:hypothetical protein